MRILVLGGTTEARRLAERLAERSEFEATLSLAGRTEQPMPQPIPYRSGGFGGIAGLAQWIETHGIQAVVDATHPFAERIAANAAAACALARVPLCVLTRAPWRRSAGDNWIEAADMASAVRALGDAPRRVFLTVGRLSLPSFEAAPQHEYLVRTVDPPDPPSALPHLTLILDRGPFDAAAETELMRAHEIQILVTKNSGGAATYGKIEAARSLGLPVVMVRAPDGTTGVPRFQDPDDVLAWLDDHRRAAALRGV
ncbi:MAG: cobalt-precorrin-6A reductase [Rhodospirillales bacterium]|nr:cobalt-precorrin-6A reductase [Rhodospirillales bacterium]